MSWCASTAGFRPSSEFLGTAEPLWFPPIHSCIVWPFTTAVRSLHCRQSHVQRSNELFLCSRYARKHFGNSSDHLLKDIQQAMGLLAFDHSTRIKRYQKLFSLTRWAELIDQFRQENFALFQLSQRSVLSVTLQAGLSALKTPYPQIPCSPHSQP